MGKTKKRKRRSMKKWMILAALVMVVITAGSAIALVFNVDKIEYVGGSHYDDNQLNGYIFEGKHPNALMYYLIGKNKTITIPFVQKYDVEITWPDEMTITIYEKPVVGYVSYMGCNMYFDKDGIVVESSTKSLDGISQITGLTFKSIVLDSKLEVSNSSVFDKILELTQGFDKYQISVDKIHFNSSSEATVYMGDVKVLLGDCEDVTDKLYELKQISAKFEGLKGTLHLDNYTTDTKSIIFQEEN